MQQKTVDLRQVEILVLDEADRMLDMGFIHDIRRILALLPKTRQNLLFSATFPDEIRKLAGSFMKDPVTVEVARRNTPGRARRAGACTRSTPARKRELLAHLVKTNDWRQVLVFCRTKHGANRLAQQLDARPASRPTRSTATRARTQRTRTLKRFKDNELRVLVATDIAARGLDIEELPHVVNFDLPHVAEDYVHRIGRTGRAGAEGEAVSLVSNEERPLHGRDRAPDEPQGREPRHRGLRARHAIAIAARAKSRAASTSRASISVLSNGVPDRNSVMEAAVETGDRTREIGVRARTGVRTRIRSASTASSAGAVARPMLRPRRSPRTSPKSAKHRSRKRAPAWRPKARSPPRRAPKRSRYEPTLGGMLDGNRKED